MFSRFIRYIVCLCAGMLFVASGLLAQDGDIGNPSFELGLNSWTKYTYSPSLDARPGEPTVACVGSSPCFDVLRPSSVPNGTLVCGSQAWGTSKNGGVYQTFNWYGQQATVTVTGRAYSVKFPAEGGAEFNNGCRVRMGLVTGQASNRSSVTTWIVFPWGNDWTQRKINIPGYGTYTLFIEYYQPAINAVMTTLWDNVILTELPPVICETLPHATIPADPAHPDTTVTITWTTDVPSTSRIDYGVNSTTEQFVEDLSPTTSHSITLTGLQPSTTYRYHASSSAQDYITWVSDELFFNTPIQFSDIATSPTPDGLSTRITWKTDAPATSQVEYGTTTSYGNTTTENTNLVTNHEVIVNGLTEDTDHHFRLWARNNPLYSSAVSADTLFHTLPAPGSSLRNGSFEEAHNNQSPSLYPWVSYTRYIVNAGYNPIDGIVGPYPASGPDYWFADIRANDGAYFLGGAASWEFKNGGVFQRINCIPNQLYTLSAKFATYSIGGTNYDTRARLGIDPNGGVDPSQVQFWSGYSPTNNNIWYMGATTVRSGSNGVITAFVDVLQQYLMDWHVVAIDDVKLSIPEEISIRQLKNMVTGSSGVLSNKIVTHVDQFYIYYDGKYYYRVYVEEEDRTAAIPVLLWVQGTDIPVTGNKLTAVGSLVIYNGKDTGLLAQEWTVDDGQYTLPKPVALLQKAIVGPLSQSHGICNTGLRVRVFGKANNVSPEDSSYTEISAFIDDGSKIPVQQPVGDPPLSGVRVYLLPSEFGVRIGDYLLVTGILTVDYVDPDGWPNGNEYYTYTVVTDTSDDWTNLTPPQY